MNFQLCCVRARTVVDLFCRVSTFLERSKFGTHWGTWHAFFVFLVEGSTHPSALGGRDLPSNLRSFDVKALLHVALVMIGRSMGMIMSFVYFCTVS
jgi:hypothetical protein